MGGSNVRKLIGGAEAPPLNIMNKNVLSLFEPLISEEKQNDNFKILSQKKFLKEQELLQTWSEPLQNRDGNIKFVKEFQENFNSPFWEMYLNALFANWNLSIDYSKKHPDFVINPKLTRIFTRLKIILKYFLYFFSFS